jgi:hypothetical protein
MQKAPRVPRALARELIQYAKSIDITVNYWHPKSTSGMEFFRQMNSPKLYKKNPKFEVNINYVETMEEPKLVAEFVDGTKWETETSPYEAVELRNMFYQYTTKIEDAMEESGGVADSSSSASSKGESKGAVKGAAKGGGKK